MARRVALLSLSSLLLQLAVQLVSAGATWPSSYDEHEDLMVLNQGYNARGLADPVTPCDVQRAPGFFPAAGILRTAFHDSGSHNVATGDGGIDFSIAYELAKTPTGPNAGIGFVNTIKFVSEFYSTQTSGSDVLALAVYTAVRGCGGPAIPIRTGRKDAKAALATSIPQLGLPRTNETAETFKAKFSRMGFTTEEMIELTACGHTLGSLHASQHPQILAAGTVENDSANLDDTPAVFDNRPATEFVSNRTRNPLVTGPRADASDTTVYEADGGLTIRRLTDERTFQERCRDILGRLLDTVPATSKLTEPIEVYEVKPGSLALALSEDGKSIIFSGEIRVRTNDRSQESIESVSVVYKDRDGAKGSSIKTSIAGTASGWDDQFAFYGFSGRLDAKSSISSFDVIITGTDGSKSTFDNNGHSFPVQDYIFVQRPSSVLSAVDGDGKQSVEVVTAVRDAASDVSLTVHLQTPRDIPFPLLLSQSVTLSKQSVLGDYTFYKGVFSVTPQQLKSTTFDLNCVSNGKQIDNVFNKLVGFGSWPTSPTDESPPASTSTSTTSTSTSTTSTTTVNPYGEAHSEVPKLIYCGLDNDCNAGEWKAQQPTAQVPVIIGSGNTGETKTEAVEQLHATATATESKPKVGEYLGSAGKLASVQVGLYGAVFLGSLLVS